jgi:uncharacterized protein YcgI (DUF1989 family)
MKTISEQTVRPNSGWYAEMARGQILRIAGKSVIDVVAFKRGDTAEFFDVARTRIYNLNIYPTKGHRLFSKQNNPMMRVLADGFAGTGHHDLQSPHGCPQLMLDVLKPLGIAPENLPDPLGLFRHMAIEQKTGRMTPSPRAPAAPAAIDLEAEIDLVVALVNCPDPKTSAPGADAVVAVLAP